jgi:anti-sigma regulatory factor (Ser/Thr protein kinase)
MMPSATPVLRHGFRVKAEEDAVPEARHTITSLVRTWNVALSEEQVAEVELLSTEVITNAIHHTQAPCAVAVQWNGVRVRVEVTDVSPVRPKPRRNSPDAEDGRGLVLVDALAADWGSFYDPAGKVV